MKTREIFKKPEIVYPVITFSILLLMGRFLGNYWLKTIAYINLVAIIVISLDFFSGTTFYLNLGILFSVGLSAYLMGFLVKTYSIPLVYAIFIGIVGGTLISLLVYLLALKVRGHYFAIGSLIFPIVLTCLITTQPLSYYFGGEGGLFIRPLFFEYLLKVPPQSRLYVQSTIYYYFSLLVLAVVYFVFLKLLNSDLGKLMRSIGQNEDLAESVGVNTRLIKFISFLLSAFTASLAGTLMGAMFPPITSNIMSASLLLLVLTMIVVGGIGSLWGPLLTTYILMILYEKLWDLIGTYRLIFYMALLVVVILLAPYGFLVTAQYKGSIILKELKKKVKRGKNA